MLEIEWSSLLALVREEGDTQEFFLPGEIQSMIEQTGSEALVAMVSMNDKILQDQHESTLGRADCD